MTKLTKKIRKGFTLVELLVVIAILAILAAVSVVGYLSFTDKAKESNDISLTAQMNTVLEANEALEGKAKTMSEALAVLEENGLVVEKLTPTSKGYSYVYDAAEGRMLLLDENYEVVAPAGASDANTYDTYVVADPKTKNVTELVDKGYGVYLPSNYVVDNNSLTINKALNVDTGVLELDNLEVKDENSTNAVVVNTMADNVTLTIPNGSVDLYGEQTKVSSSTASNSLHVYGKVLQLELVKGKVVAMTNAVISTVDTTAAEAGATVEVKKDGGTIGAVIKAEGATNVTVDSSLNDVVYSSEEVNTDFAGGVGTEASPYLISNEQQFSNVNALSDEMKSGKEYHFVLLSDLVIDDTYKVNVGDETIIENFRGTFNGMDHKLTINTHHTNYTSSTAWFAVFYNLLANENEKTTIENLNVYYAEMEASWVSLAANIGDKSNNGLVEYNNINFYNEGNILNTLGNNNGLFVGYVNASFAAHNCNNYANMNISGVSGVWIGAIYQPDLKDGTVVFDNVNNYATISGQSLAYYNGNAFYISNYDLSKYVTINNSHNYGSVFKFNSTELRLFGDVSGNNLSFDKETAVTLNADGGVARNILSTGNITYSVGENGKLTINKSSDQTIVSYQIKYSSHYSSKSTSQNGGFAFTFNLDTDEEYLYNAKFATVLDENYDDYEVIKTVTSDNPTNIPFVIGIKDGKTYIVINNLYEHLLFADAKDVTLGSTTIQIFGLNENGDIVDFTQVK